MRYVWKSGAIVVMVTWSLSHYVHSQRQFDGFSYSYVFNDRQRQIGVWKVNSLIIITGSITDQKLFQRIKVKVIDRILQSTIFLFLKYFYYAENAFYNGNIDYHKRDDKIQKFLTQSGHNVVHVRPHISYAALVIRHLNISK